MVTLDYTAELFEDVTSNYWDYHQIGWTVCGAQDPAVIHINEELGNKYPNLAGYGVVRVKEKYVNPWISKTFLEFSNEDMTALEIDQYEEFMREEYGEFLYESVG